MDKKKSFLRYSSINAAFITLMVVPPYMLLDQHAQETGHYESKKPITFPVEEVKMAKAEPLKPLPFYRESTKIKLSKKQFDCLAKNIYHEAGVENRAGKIAVAQVTFNRINKRRSWTTVCKVVYAKSQFSWTLFAKKRYEKPRGKLWRESVKAAQDFLDGTRVRGLDDSVYYHADYINKPSWTKNLEEITKIGRHVFYQYASR